MDRQIKNYQQEIEKFQAIEQSATSKNDSISSRGGYNVPPSPSNSERGKPNYISPESENEYKSPSPGPPYQTMSEYDIEQDLTDIKTWMNEKTGDKKKDHKVFNKKMTELFTKRTDEHRYQIALQWEQTNDKALIESIEYKLGGKTRGSLLYSVYKNIYKLYTNCMKRYSLSYIKWIITNSSCC